MKCREELDFQFWRFLTFTLLAIVVAGLYGYVSLKTENSQLLERMVYFNLLMFVFFVISIYYFLKNFFILRKKFELTKK